MASTGVLPVAPKRKQVSVTEMLEYVKGLDIDPIKEADMLWIAEEAFNANLPPGWTEHQDDQGRVYFHSASTGESTWRHPMDDLFREIVNYQRRVMKAGGFWQVEDEIAELEENIRLNLADWMELYDEHGEKFFYNKKNDESRFDDPRMAVYHSLYARIKLVAKMKERLPVLARAMRPEEPSEQDVMIQKRVEEEEQRCLAYLIKIQSFARVILARRKVRLMQALRTVQKGPQPLRGKLRLRMEKLGPGGSRELVLSQTTGHRRHRAATKIQARVRGVLARRRFRPLVVHRAYLSKVMTKIQAHARVWHAKRRTMRLREERFVNAAVNIQRAYRGYRDRQYVSALRAEKLRFEWMMKSVVMIQSGMRMHLAYKEFKRRRYTRFAACVSLIKQQVKVFLKRRELHRNKLLQEPVQAELVFNTNPKSRSVVPWSWKMWTTPQVFAPEATPTDGRPLKYGNIFSGVGPQNYRDVAATRLQSRARTMVARNKLQELKEVANEFFEAVFVRLHRELAERDTAAVMIQKMVRGKATRTSDVITRRKQQQLREVLPQIKTAQAYIRRFFAQEWLQAALDRSLLERKATMIQAQWRGWMARRHVERLSEEALWPMKGWFEYTATGREMVHLEVRFLPNPGFDDYKYFVQHGSYDELEMDMEDVDDVIARVLRNHPEKEGPLTPEGSKAGSAAASRRTSHTESALGSRLPSRSRPSEPALGSLQQAPPRAGSRKGSRLPSARSSVLPEELPEEPVQGSRAGTKGSLRGPHHLPSSLPDREGAPGSARSQHSHASHRLPRASASEPMLPAQPVQHTEEVPPALPVGKMPDVPEETEEEAAPQSPAAEAAPPTAASRPKPVQAEASKAVKRPVHGAKSAPPPKGGRKSAAAAAPEAADGPAEAPPPESSAPRAADPTAEISQAAAPAQQASAAEEAPLAAGGLSHAPSLEYSAASLASDGEGEERSAASKPKAKRKPKAPEQPPQPVPEEQPREAQQKAATAPLPQQQQQPQQHKAALRTGLPARPRKKSPPKEREPMVPEAMPSLATCILADAPEHYKDKYEETAPPRHPDDPPRRPKQRAPSNPPAPSAGSSTQELFASAAAALRGSQRQMEAEAVGATAKRKTYGGTLEGGKFVRAQVESVDELSAGDKQAILEDLLAAQQKKEQALAEKETKRARRKQEEDLAKAEKMQATMSEAEAQERDLKQRKVKELKKWFKKKKEEADARKARDAEMLKLVMDKESKKSETLKQLEKDRLAQRERRLRQAELQRAHLEAKLLLSKDAAKMEMTKGATMYPAANQQQQQQPATLLPHDMLPPVQHPVAMQAPGGLAPWQEQQLWQMQQQQQQQDPLQHQQKQLLLLQQQHQLQLQLQQQQQLMQQQMSPQDPSGHPYDLSQQPQLQPLQEVPQEQAEGQPLQHLEQLHHLRGAISAQPRQPQAQRVVHRHIHHHMHYHEGDPDSGGEGPPGDLAAASPAQQRQIEAASEARVRAQLEARGPPELGAGPGMQHSASAAGLSRGSFEGARLAALQRSASLAPGLGLSLPALDADLGRRQGLQRYAGSVQRAIGSYADSGRPRFARSVAV